MSLTTDDFAEFMADDPEDNKEIPLGDALQELATDIELDAVEEVRNVRERL
ncbi:hypothetical protein [Natronorubrum sulfidifaciens]|uniref:Uncharacterized protein n=1 Tax=Natronorubrum sulfidifaciens JCM 14089 TaxID=1230460 RepID=L9VXA7_9EURY|nr:hypothetical protein [Natronorubrum sulfidifaciens]ELY41647.1 hypothetical protein C495_16600 [Natronorubrum sulfidifaciens JCM 14089]